jgi:hypothetical protein
MRPENDDRWKALCSQAAIEKDPAKLMELVNEVNRLSKRKKAERRRTERETITQIQLKGSPAAASPVYAAR